MAKNFSIKDVPSLRATSGAVYADIAFLAKEEHTQAFAEIFEKFVQDNGDLLDGYEVASVAAKRPVPTFTMKQLRDTPQKVARLLYEAFTPEVRIALRGSRGSKVLRIEFDNPLFEFQKLL